MIERNGAVAGTQLQHFVPTGQRMCGGANGKLKRGSFSIVVLDDEMVVFSCWGNRERLFFSFLFLSRTMQWITGVDRVSWDTIIQRLQTTKERRLS